MPVFLAMVTEDRPVGTRSYSRAVLIISVRCSKETLQLTHVPQSKTGMLIRKPVAEVYTAFVDPAITTKFWFTKSSGRLEVGQRVQWDRETYGV